MELRTENVAVRFDGAPALSGVSVAVPLGTHAGICGAPGSGKTTLLKVLAGLRRPDEGRVLWDGQDVWALSPNDRRDRQSAFGMVFQSDALFDSEPILRNVELPLLRRKVPRREARDRALQALEDVGIASSAALLPDQLSGGMRKRAGIARAIAARPKILLADDPVAGLDPSTGAQIGELLRRVSEGRTLLVALPDPVPYLTLDRWLLLENGRVAHEGRYDEATLERV